MGGQPLGLGFRTFFVAALVDDCCQPERGDLVLEVDGSTFRPGDLALAVGVGRVALAQLDHPRGDGLIGQELLGPFERLPTSLVTRPVTGPTEPGAGARRGCGGGRGFWTRLEVR